MTVDTVEGAQDASLTAKEPLLDESTSRWCMFPIRYNSIWEYYKKAEASFWTGEVTSAQCIQTYSLDVLLCGAQLLCDKVSWHAALILVHVCAARWIAACSPWAWIHVCTSLKQEGRLQRPRHSNGMASGLRAVVQLAC